MLNIITNNHVRQFRYSYEVPNDILESDFDYLDEEEETDGYFQYRGTWYHISEFMVSDLAKEYGYDGLRGDSYFSGIAIRILDSGSYQVALFLS